MASAARSFCSVSSPAGTVTSKYVRLPAGRFSRISTSVMSAPWRAMTPVSWCRTPGPGAASTRSPTVSPGGAAGGVGGVVTGGPARDDSLAHHSASGSHRMRPMRREALGATLAVVALGAASAHTQGKPPIADIRFITLDPGHFHAALVQKEMYAGVSPSVNIYAPLGQDLLDHLARVAGFNRRAGNPTAWQLEVHTGPDFLERMLREHPGNAVVISGRNRGKIDRIQSSLDAGLHALVDKPWILEAADLPRLDRALAAADERGLVALDIMTERFEVTSELQRELVNDPATFGTLLPGSEAEPAVYMESVHYLKKVVAGAPNPRPVWFFDTEQQGEGLNDIGTHLVDLTQWTLYPDQAID